MNNDDKNVLAHEEGVTARDLTAALSREGIPFDLEFTDGIYGYFRDTMINTSRINQNRAREVLPKHFRKIGAASKYAFYAWHTTENIQPLEEFKGTVNTAGGKFIERTIVAFRDYPLTVDEYADPACLI